MVSVTLFVTDERGDLRVKFPRRGNFMYPAEVTFCPSGLTYGSALPAQLLDEVSGYLRRAVLRADAWDIEGWDAVDLDSDESWARVF